MNSTLSKSCHSGLLAVGLCLAWPSSVWPQSITATLPVDGEAVAVNKATNKIYLAGPGPTHSTWLISVIDGTTHATTTVPAGPRPCALAINEATNRIYVTNSGGLVGGEVFLGNGSITVIDGATNSSTTVTDPNAKFPCALAVNPSTNKIYVANGNYGNTTVTIIDGATNSTTTVVDPNANGNQLILPANAVAVNPITNRVYVANNGSPGNITVIDGETNATTTVTDPHAISPNAVAVNVTTNKIYVTNGGAYPAINHGNVTVLDGATNSTTTITDPNALAPQALAVDQSANKIYVANANNSALSWHGVVTVIDGATNSVTSVIDPNAQFPDAVAVDEHTNTIYVSNGGCVPGPGNGCSNPGSNLGSITVINGETNGTKTLIDPKANAPQAVGVDPMTDQIYVANATSGNLTVIAGAGAATTHTLAVLLTGSGSGTVTSSPSGLDCGTSCTTSLAAGTAVSLYAAPSSGSVFSGWSGPCGGTASCDLTANDDQFVTAAFSKLVSVPNTVGLTQAAATTAIAGAGLAVGAVTQQSSSTVASGYIISESPAAGTDVASGSAVSLVVSTGGSSGGGTSSYGGGGGIDAFTLGVLLGSLIVALRTAGASARLRLRGTYRVTGPLRSCEISTERI